MKPTIVVDAPTFYLYKILGLGNSASAAEIKEAYKQHITKHNPDNYPGASDIIKLVQHAYEVLGNYETRRIYDLFCTHILYSGTDSTCAGSRQMFMYPKPDWVVQKNDIVYVMDMSIRNMYHGKKTKVITKDTCVDVDIARGTKDGQRLVYKGKGLKTATSCLPGDLIVIINRIDYPFFLQKGTDLFCKIDIDENVAQGGGEIFIRHPLGNIVGFQLNPNEITKTGVTKMLKGKGLGSSDKREPGDLYIEFNLCFPDPVDLT